ncbi:copper amine oxidase [Photobacterium leiognathi]|uniref:copper amine oxidase n=1 Tax=Photobacterium leiognathi TaxID=553611 RepID=UPI002980B8F3|nr:hypothetical protein [Photobacterium leiognathi]
MKDCKPIYSLLMLLCLAISIPAHAMTTSDKYQCPSQQQFEYQFESGNRWQFCWQWDSRYGVSLHDVSFSTVRGSTNTYIASAIALNQIELVDAQNTSNINQITQLDKTQSTLSGNCPNGTLLSDSDNTPLLCIKPSSEDYAMHNDGDSRRKNSVDVLSLITVDNNQFVSRLRLHDDGSFTPSASLITDSSNNTHYIVNYFWRLDLDIGATATNDHVEEFRTHIRKGRNKREIRTNTVLQPAEFKKQYDRKKMKSWRIYDGQITNEYDMPSSYHIFPLGHAAIERDVQRPWTESDVYFTNYHPCEHKALNNNEADCAENVVQMVDQETITDVVAWVKLTAHHTPPYTSSNDLALVWQEFTVYPRDVYSRNPNDPEPEIPIPLD